MSTPRTPALTAPIRLNIKDREEWVDFSEDGYDDPPLKVKLWVNPGDRLVRYWLEGEKDAEGAVVQAPLTTGELLLKVIREWTLQTADGQPAPLRMEVLDELPSEVVGMLSDEFWLRRQAPLAARRERRSSMPARATPPVSIVPTS